MGSTSIPRQPGADARRPMRADARRNYQHILEVAREVFTEAGPEAPLDDIARRAGVGAGTLYRHFPNRDALIEAVYRDDIERLSEMARHLLESRPSDALQTWIREHVRYAFGRKGLAATLKATLGADNEVFQLCKTLINDAASALLIPAQQAGAVRADLEPRDLLRLAHGIALATENDPAAAERLLAVMLDGLRPPADARPGQEH